MSRCPGCGRCQQCGQPYPVTPFPVYPQPWPSVPVYPGTNPWGYPPTMPYRITYGNTTNLTSGGMH